MVQTSRTPRSAIGAVGDAVGLAKRPLLVPVLLGIATGGIVVGFRYAGLLTGPWAVLVLALCLVMTPSRMPFAERFMIMFALAFGWLPLLGWLPGAGTSVDLPGLTLGIASGYVCAARLRARGSHPIAEGLPTLSPCVGLLLGVFVMLWWGLPYAGLRISGRLSYLLNAYDNATHFQMFRSNLELGSFISARRHLPDGALRLGWDYPQGIHQAWAQIVHLWTTHPPSNTNWQLNSYATVLVITSGASVVLVCMAAVRICRRDLASALPVMAGVAGLYCFGFFAPFNGYPNFDLAVVAAAVAVTVSLRPTMHPNWSFFVVAGLGLGVAYNWYPMLLVAAPAIVMSAVQAWAASGQRHRLWLIVAGIATMVAYAMPVTLFLHRGVNTLNLFGGAIPVPWGLLFATAAVLTSLVVYRHVLQPDLRANVVFGAPAVLGLAGVFVIIGYEILSKGSVSYYGEKFSMGVFGVCFVVLLCVAAGQLTQSELRRRLPPLAMATVVVLVSLLAIEINGYVGPLSNKLPNTALDDGVVEHSVLTSQSRTSIGAGVILEAAQIAHSAEGSSSGRIGQWWFVNPAVGYFSFIYGEDGVWFAALRDNMTEGEYDTITLKVAPRMAAAGSIEEAARLVVRYLGDPRTGRVHLFVPAQLRTAIVSLDRAWGRPGALFIVPPPEL